MGTGEDFSRRASVLLRDRGISIRAAARALAYDHAYLARVLAGKQSPSPQLVDAFERYFLPRSSSTADDVVLSGPQVSAARGADLADAIRAASKRLVLLDNSLTGVPIAEMAARTFRTVHHRLGIGDYDARYERDIQAAAAELAEVAGWACFDAEKHSAARRFNQEALLLAQLSGDRSIELLIMQNLAMHAGWLGRHREELAIARAVLEGRPLPPRVEAMFRVREAKGLVESGQLEAGAKAFGRARALYADGEHHHDPYWAWWLTPGEIDGHEGYGFQVSGDHSRGIPYLERALHLSEPVAVGYRSISAARLLDCLLAVRRWRDAEDLALRVTPTVHEIASGRTLSLLRDAAEKGRRIEGAPVDVRDALSALATAVDADPFDL
ncbi:helix-turn-helix transcriptional regulator [Streptomyces pactum]|uniref:Helix-turn-helix transcriptional regulator n=1 Tax=Streptomyces pactum TaxID=68249 RepID=A0ABS0NF55_9ACTN|nr:helix-turn-helix transcriptional regulator [Streptomyces pactum]MBH5333791.1 helix-turn-helix transcriptional regulator [Streptomyces pactum]